MWFKSEPRNRRLHRGHVLDVKVRSDQARATRTRLVAVAFAVTFGTVFGLYLLWRTGEWALDKVIYENSTFAIQNVDVQTDGVIPPEQLRRWANVRPGANLIALDQASVRRNLELVPAIEFVSVERLLPCTLKIRVKERIPVAQVGVPVDGSGGIALAVFQLDRHGFVMRPLDPGRRVVSPSQLDVRLPEIKGLSPLVLQPGQRVDSVPLAAALALVTEFDRSPMATLADLRSVDISQPGVVIARTAQGGEITFAPDHLAQEFARWRGVYDYGRQMNKGEIATLDLAVTNNIPVRWAAAGGLSATAPMKSNPAKIRRKNV